MSQPGRDHPQIILRRALPTEADLVSAITDAAYARYVPQLGRKPQPMTVDYRELIALHPVWLLFSQDQPTGVLALEYEPDQLLIYSVAVLPEQQKKGFGRFLLDFAEQDAREHGYNRIRLYTNALMVENIALYLRLGYLETHRESFQGTTLVHMAKDIVA